jgi:hypothetical protein
VSKVTASKWHAYRYPFKILRRQAVLRLVVPVDVAVMRHALLSVLVILRGEIRSEYGEKEQLSEEINSYRIFLLNH